MVSAYFGFRYSVSYFQAAPKVDKNLNRLPENLPPMRRHRIEHLMWLHRGAPGDGGRMMSFLATIIEKMKMDMKSEVPKEKRRLKDLVEALRHEIVRYPPEEVPADSVVKRYHGSSIYPENPGTVKTWKELSSKQDVLTLIYTIYMGFIRDVLDDSDEFDRGKFEPGNVIWYFDLTREPARLVLELTGDLESPEEDDKHRGRVTGEWSRPITDVTPEWIQGLHNPERRRCDPSRVIFD